MSDKTSMIHWPNGRARGVQRSSNKHDAMINAIIAEPCILRQDLAARFGYSPGWVSQILASEVIQSRLAERRAELTGQGIRPEYIRATRASTPRPNHLLDTKLEES